MDDLESNKKACKAENAISHLPAFLVVLFLCPASDGQWIAKKGPIRKGDLTTNDSLTTSEQGSQDYASRNERIHVKHYEAANALVITEENKYDYVGNRIEKSVSDGATTEVSRNALNGWNSAKLPSPPGRGVGARRWG